MHGTLYASGSDEKSYKICQVKPVCPGQAVTNLADLSISDTELRDGDLLTVFNSIQRGDELLKVTIDLAPGENAHQTEQKGIDKKLWYTLFFNRLPAHLKKPDGREIDGVLDPFSEQGMEGFIHWSVYDFKNNSYDSLHTLEKGDILTVFSAVTQGNKEWEGRVEIKDKPFATGRKIMTVSIDPDDATFQSFVPREVSEVLSRTHVSPTHDQLDFWNIHHRPVQVTPASTPH